MKYSELQEENKQLKEQLKYLRKNEYLNHVKWGRNFNEYLVKELQHRINEAIEYIESNEKEYGSLEENEKIILNILRGEDNE